MNLFIKIALLIFLQACSKDGQREIDLAASKAKDGQHNLALTYYERAILRNPESAVSLQAARDAFKVAFYDIKDYRRSIKALRHLVLYSNDPKERLDSQKKIVEVLFENLSDYDQSILETNKLVGMLPDLGERVHYKVLLAKSYYFKNNFSQAENEVEEFLKQKIGDNERFELLQLKANIDIANKNLPAAIQVFQELMQKFPERSQKANIPLTMSVVYEENKDFKGAIAVLEALKVNHPMPEYIDIRIKRVRDRQKNQPGARGMRK